MRLVTMRRGDSTVAARQEGDGFVPVEGYTDVGTLLADPSWPSIAARAAGEIVSSSVPLAPAVVQPAKIVCAGLNYSSHITEMGRDLPSHPTLFAKFPDTLTGPFDDIQAPVQEECLDWEGELAVVVGRTAYQVSEREAADCIAGYSIANDISMRTWQHRTTQWLQGKAWFGTTPLGPQVVTVDEFDAATAWLTTTVNGEVMQRHAICDLLFGPADLIAYVSTFTPLHPGDVVLTGTPGGVGAARSPRLSLHPGDEVSVRIDGLAEIRNRVVRPT